MLTIPSWAVAILVTLVIAILGFAWRLATKAETSAAKLEAAVEKLTSLETRIAVIATLETADALRKVEVAHLATRTEEMAKEISHLREARHKTDAEVHSIAIRIDSLQRELSRLHARASGPGRDSTP